MDDLKEYKNQLYTQSNFGAEADSKFPEESFFEIISEMLSEAGILDNVEYCPFRQTPKGIRIDGYSWNPLERTICGILVNFTNEPDLIETLTKTDIDDAGKRVTRFFQKVLDDKFVDSLAVTDPGRIAALDIREYLEDALKFRIVFLTDQIISTRVRKVSIEKILDKDTSIEIWDLERLRDLDRSGADYEEFTVDLLKLGGGIRALPANVSEDGMSTYLGVLPGSLLSAIYDEFGQRLLESNVRTFLDFRAATNKGMRKTLCVEPEHFFAYNNGLTVTATDLSTETVGGQLLITELENMQIVNGGQTTASIYFSPRDRKGSVKGAEKEYYFRDIDLTQVNIQMKLTVVGRKEIADTLKANIATYANSQNSIQQSDLVSNHPFHLNVETRSRNQLMPPGETGLPTKWFYERVRGQYSTQLRAMSSAAQTRFSKEYPKSQLFSKTDLAKYENTWRMQPHIVKKGAQANLKALGAVIIKEFEKDEDAFGASFYKDIVAKMILFRESDNAIATSDWYREERGLKVETLVFTLSLIRRKLIDNKSDINLESIYNNQSLSETLRQTILSTAKYVRERISDQGFRDGVQNPSEFCKSERGWKKLQNLEIDLSTLSRTDVLSTEELTTVKRDKKELDKASKSISDLDYVMDITQAEWRAIAEYFASIYSFEHKYVGLSTSYANVHLGRLPSEKQLKLAVIVREEAYSSGFDFVAA